MATKQLKFDGTIQAHIVTENSPAKMKLGYWCDKDKRYHKTWTMFLFNGHCVSCSKMLMKPGNKYSWGYI